MGKTDKFNPGQAPAEDLLTTTENEEQSDFRVEKIEEQIENAMLANDPLHACLGAANGDLMLIQYRMCQVLSDSLQHGDNSVASLTDVLPTLNTLTKLSQQIERYNQLLCKLKLTNSEV